MALANLNINVTANVAPVVNAMTEVKAVTSVNMGKAGESVKAFQTDFAASSAKVQQQSAQMSSQMQTDSAAMGKASEAASEAIGSIGASVNATTDAFSGMSKGMDEAGKKFKAAIGPEAAENVKSATDRVEEFVATRVAIAAVGVALGAVAATVATVGYAAYKATGFIAGLFTGSSYKSDNIDALIAMNKQVVELQKNLQLAAGDASALNDALQRIGVDRGDYTTVYNNVETAIRGNTDELDRLGIAYKDVNGKALETRQVVENAKKALDEYTTGWDRNQAAAAIGLGTYDQLNNYLKINQVELQKSKDRMNEYNLTIGPETQQYVDQYNAAMLEFKNETRLMGEGFKRVFADQVMPAFTMFAEALKDGWPSIINGTRHVLAAFTSMGYGIKMVFDLVWDTVSGTTKSLGGILAAFAAAAEQAAHGNFKAAADIVLTGAHDSVNSLKAIGDRVTADATKNLNAMKLAQGMFNKDNTPAGMPGSGKTKGKNWTPAPGAEEEAEAYKGTLFADMAKQGQEAYMRYLHAFEEQKASVLKAGFAQESEINKQAYEWGLKDLKSYLEDKHRINQAALQAEITAKQNELKDAKAAEEAAAKKFNSVTGEGLKELNDAAGRTQKSMKDLTDAQSKLTVAKLTDADETKNMTKDQLDGNEKIRIQLLELKGLYAEAADAKIALEKGSKAYGQMDQATKDNQDELLFQQKIDGIVKGLQEQQKFTGEVESSNIAILKSIGLETNILEAQSKVKSLQSDIDILLIQAVNQTGAQRDATLALVAAKRNELDITNKLSIADQQRRDVLSGKITGFNGTIPIYRDQYDKEKAASNYVPQANLDPGASGGNRTANATQNNNININVTGGANPTETGNQIAAAIRNGVQSFDMQMMRPINGGFLQ